MKAAIITIGDEILIGQITDTNSGFIAKALDKIGIQTHEMLSISDDKNHILQTFALLQNKVDLVVITGGLGPTKDDITKKTFCDYFDDSLVVNEQVLQHVTHIFEHIIKQPVSQINKDQALVPSKCQVLFNKMGTAPGMWMQHQQTIYISMPGVPYEMKYLLEHEIIPKLVHDFERPYIVHKTLMTYGQGESRIAERIEDWENNLPEFIKLAYLPAPGRVRLRLTARGANKLVLENAIEENVASVSKIIGDIIVGFEEEDAIEVVVARHLTQQNKTISFAESCSMGKIASKFAYIAGASKFFKGGIICYDIATKVSVLGVEKNTILKHSVVSKEVAMEMALNAKKLFKTDIAVATTGNAGPTLGDSATELGTVIIALATENQVFAEEFTFGQPREKVIDRTVNKALEMILKEISKKM